MRDFFRDEISSNKIIGFEMEIDDGQIYFKTNWGPYVEPLLYISNLFPNVDFDLFYEEPDSQFEGWYEFRDGHLLTDFSISKEDSGWIVDIHKSKFKTEDGFKKHYRSQLSCKRRLKFNFSE